MRSTLIAIALLSLPALAIAGESGGRHVIPPGQEATIQSMLEPAGGKKLPGRFELDTAQIEKDHVVATFKGPRKASFKLVLRHPAQAIEGDPEPLLSTDTVALVLREPAKLGRKQKKAFNAVVALVKAKSPALKWSEVAAGKDGGPKDPKSNADEAGKLSKMMREAEDLYRKRFDDKAKAKLNEVIAEIEAIEKAGSPPSHELDWASLLARKLGLEKKADELAQKAVAHAANRAKDQEGRKAEPWEKVNYAAALAVAGKPDETRKVFQELWKAQPELAKECKSLDVTHMVHQAGHSTLAIELIQGDMKQGCASAPAYASLALLHAQSGKDDAVLGIIDEGLKKHPGDATLNERKASFLFRQGRVREARQHYDKVWEKDDKYPGLLAPLGAAYVMVDDDRGKNIDRMQARIAKNPKDAVALYLLGMLYFYTEKYEEAIPPLRKSIELRGDAGRMFIYMAMSHQRLGKSDVAAEWIEKAIAVDPYDPDVYYCRSLIKRSTDLELAANDLELYLKLSEGPARYQHPGKTDKVKEEIRKMRQGIVPPDPHSKFTKGETGQK